MRRPIHSTTPPSVVRASCQRRVTRAPLAGTSSSASSRADSGSKYAAQCSGGDRRAGRGVAGQLEKRQVRPGPSSSAHERVTCVHRSSREPGPAPPARSRRPKPLPPVSMSAIVITASGVLCPKAGRRAERTSLRWPIHSVARALLLESHVAKPLRARVAERDRPARRLYRSGGRRGGKNTPKRRLRLGRVR